ncbi:hypothetical protein P154DRAFT_587810 [Amniculicola lignicola CBS 123094]|uniref:Uncharacterized protein n=1 Tax=Amniculicola lignicola CBS 123094 TaxID=1392246 RepID=A0A6A5WTZ8_9PLEO|nr:hypothetical protein P154DRAFT_587810 [Amniculicola lignicola CBS 123094]
MARKRVRTNTDDECAPSRRLRARSTPPITQVVPEAHASTNGNPTLSGQLAVEAKNQLKDATRTVHFEEVVEIIEIYPNSSNFDSTAHHHPDSTIHQYPGSIFSLDNELLARIKSAIEHSTLQANAGKPVQQSTRFTLPLPSASLELELLNKAEKQGVAVCIWESPNEKCFEVGISSTPFRASEIGADWWKGMAPGHMRAGPFATRTEAKKAEGILKGLETKRMKGIQQSKRWGKIEDKLNEGLRRQEAGEKMYDDGSEDDGVEDDGRVDDGRVDAGSECNRG